MGLEIITLSEVSSKKEDKHHMILHICSIKNKTQINSSVRQTHRHGEQIPDFQEAGEEGKDKMGVWS